MNILYQSINMTCRAISEVMRVMLFAMFLIFISLVITRYFFSYSPPWSEEVSRFMLVWMTMLGASVLVLYQDHFALHILIAKLPAKWQQVHSVITGIAVGLISLLIALKSVDFTLNATSVIAPGSGLPMSVAKSSLLVGSGLMVVFSTLSVLDNVFRLMGSPRNLLPPQDRFMDSSFRPSDPESDAASVATRAPQRG